MPAKGLQKSRRGNGLRRRSTLDLLSLAPPAAEDMPSRGTVSAEFQRRDRPVTPADETDNDDVQRVSSLMDSPTTTLGPSRPSIDSTWSRPFSFYKWKHASDSHLATKTRKQRDHNIPPVPALPLEPPLIITTGPTIGPSADSSHTSEKRKSRFPLFPRSKSPERPVPEPSKEKTAAEKKAQKEKRRTVFGSFRMPSRESAEQIQRGAQSLDLNGLMPGQRPSDASSDTLAIPSNERLAPARSHEEPASLASLFDPPSKRPKPLQARTWIPKKRRNRESLFPLPDKVSPSHFPNTAPATPRASTSGLSSSGSPHRSPAGEPCQTPALLHRSPTSDGIGHSQLTTPHHALAASSITFAAPASTLFRHDSTSGRSDRSALALNLLPGSRPLRTRANTLSSLGARSEDNTMAPPLTPPIQGGGSGRNSTSTAGRSSFSNLLTLGHRFRHGSDPHNSRQHSPALGNNGNASAINSQSNSFSMSREGLKVTLPDREEGESAGKYLARVEDCVDRSQIPSVLSKQHDEFFMTVMRSFMRKFAFFGDPLDMAIRKLLMEVDLPKETQQIDRFLQSFADRYHECNPGIFANAEKAYFIAFSILILQTDAFNKNNKRKMTKVDYRKNSSIDGVSDEVLDCFYDNIVYTPFIRVEDEIDFKSAMLKSKKTLSKRGTVEQLKTAAKASEPLDPYALIMDSKLDVLRPPLKDVMNLDDPYSYIGTASNLDLRLLNKNSKCGVLQIESLRSRPDAFLSPSTIDNPQEARSGLVDLPVDKVGTLWRKDPKKKAARSPWQEWGAILTGSGVSFFKNAGWVKHLMHQYDTHRRHGSTEGSCVFRPPIHQFKPDHFVPTEHAVALHDSSYKRHKNAFVFFSGSGSDEVFLADNETDMNDWLAKINHQASYRTAGIRPRGLVGGNYEGQRQRALRRLQSSTSTRTVQTPTGEVTIQSGNIDFLLAQQISAARRESMRQKISEFEERLGTSIKQLDTQLRDARHLLLLAPIQPKSREQLMHAASKMAAQLKWIRIEVWRMKCHRDILALDLDDENKLAGASPTQRSSPSLLPIPSPRLTTMPSNERLAPVALPLHLNLPGSPVDAADPQTQPTSPTLLMRPATKETLASHETDDSDEQAFKTPPEHTPQPSPAFPPEAWENGLVVEQPSDPRASSSVSNRTLSPKLDATAAEASSTASSMRDAPETPIGSEFGTTLADDRDSVGRKASISNAQHSRPGTATSESDLDHSAVPASPESRGKGVRRSLHRSLRDGTPLSQRSHRRGKESGSSVVSDGAQHGTGDFETLSRAKGSFTVHGKKASVVTFGSEWQDMSAEEKLKLRKQAQAQANDSSNPRMLSAVESDPEPASPTTPPPQQRDLRASSITSSYQSSIGARRESNATAQSDPKSDIRSIQERRAARKLSQQSIAGIMGSPAEPMRQGSTNTLQSQGAQQSDGQEQGSDVQRVASPQQAVEA